MEKKCQKKMEDEERGPTTPLLLCDHHPMVWHALFRYGLASILAFLLFFLAFVSLHPHESNPPPNHLHFFLVFFTSSCLEEQPLEVVVLGELVGDESRKKEG